jgi:YfiH family protein
VEWREKDGVRWLEADLGGARAAFSTRLGGLSEPPFDSLNLGILTDDDCESVEENRCRLARALGRDPEQIVFALQVHGTRLLEQPAIDPPAEADGHIVREPGPAPLVFVADCLPVALYGPEGLAMVHAGWRGLAGGIVGDAAAAVGATSAAIGPVIGPCCYEVGEEVVGAFAGLRLDLPEVARRLLAAAGVERVESAGLCTGCERELFFSHRRDHGRTGRQAGIAWIEQS